MPNLNPMNWFKPKKLATFAPKAAAAALYQPVAIDTAVGLLFEMSDPDETLRKLGYRRQDLRVLETDDEISAAMDTRREAVISTAWRMEPGTGPLVDWVWEELEPHMDGLLRGGMAALPYGYSVQEVIYTPKDGRIGIRAIDEKPFEWFSFRPDGTLFYRDPRTAQDLDVLTVYPNKFLLTQHQPSYRNPFGEALFSRLYWPWFFRTNGWKFWATALERCGTPFLKGTAPLGSATDSNGDLIDNVTLLSQVLGQAVQNATVALPEGWNVEFLSATQTGASFEGFEQSCLKRIQRLILGQTLTSDTGSDGGGSYALGKVHNEVREDRRNADIRMVTRTVQTLIDYLWAVNGFAGEAPEFVMDDGKGLEEERAARDATLVNAGIVKLSETYLYRVYDFEPGEIEVPETPEPVAMPGAGQTAASAADDMMEDDAEDATEEPVTATDFAALTFAPIPRFPDQEEVDRAAEIVATADAQNQAMAEAMLAPVLKLIVNATSYQEVQAGLAAQFPDMSTTQLEERLARIMFAADLWGVVNAGQP